jgi:hypothetical protein
MLRWSDSVAKDSSCFRNLALLMKFCTTIVKQNVCNCRISEARTWWPTRQIRSPAWLSSTGGKLRWLGCGCMRRDSKGRNFFHSEVPEVHEFMPQRGQSDFGIQAFVDEIKLACIPLQLPTTTKVSCLVYLHHVHSPFHNTRTDTM